MELETFLSGYCRALDQSRMVAVVIENSCLSEADCSYPDCSYEPNCPIAKKIRDIVK